MDINQLDKRLTEIEDAFSSNMHLNQDYVECGKTPATMGDLYNLGRETHAALGDYHSAIIEYLKSL